MNVFDRLAAVLVGERVTRKAARPFTIVRRDRLVREVVRLRQENAALLGRADTVSYLAAGYRRLVERDISTRAAAHRADCAVAAWMNAENKERDQEPFGTPPVTPFRPLPPLKPTPVLTPPSGDAA